MRVVHSKDFANTLKKQWNPLFLGSWYAKDLGPKYIKCTLINSKLF